MRCTRVRMVLSPGWARWQLKLFGSTVDFFVLRPDIFRYINEGEELVEQPFGRLIAERKLVTYQWGGFWQAMDTFKDKIGFDRMEARGQCPWMVWGRHPADRKP